MLRFYALLSFLLLALFTTSQETRGVLSMVITDSRSKLPVADAFVSTPNAGFIAIADENGFVDLQNLSDTVSFLIVTRIGYESKAIEMQKLNDDDKLLIVLLESKISSLSEVMVNAVASGSTFKTVSELDIHLRPINNSQEALRMIPGLFVGQHAGGGKSEQIFLRGFDIDHGTDINITVDGIPVNMVSHAHGQGYADLHWVIPELIDKISFDKGPYFADKGNFTTAGYVAVKTKNHLDNNFIKMEGGQMSTFRTIMGLNLLRQQERIKGQSLFFAGEASFTNGYFDSPQHFKRLNGILKYHGKLKGKTTLTAMLTGFTSKWNASGQIPARAVEDGRIGFYGAIDDTEGGNTSRYNANVALVTNNTNGGILRNRLSFTYNDFELYSNFTFFKIDPVNGDQIRQSENRQLISYEGSYQQNWLLGKIKTQTTTGMQVRFDAINDLELSRTKKSTTTLSSIMLGDVKELNVSAYWSQQWSLHPGIEITTGLRADIFYNKYKDRLAMQNLSSGSALLSPKFNISYRINNQVKLYWHNGKGFHSNDTRVAVQQNGRKVAPPGLGSDIGAVVNIGKRIMLQTAVWYLQLQQEFIYVGDVGIVEASGKSNRKGVDFSMRYELAPNLFTDLDISVANPRAAGLHKKESYLPLAPRFTSVGGVTYKKQVGFNGSLRYRYMGNRPANEDNSIVAEGYCIMDAAIHYAQKMWEAGISIQNVFNTKWKETQFETESRLQNEPANVSEIHFTPGTPFFLRINFTVNF